MIAAVEYLDAKRSEDQKVQHGLTANHHTSRYIHHKARSQQR